MLVQGLVREPFDAAGETVAVHRGPVDAAVRRVRVVDPLLGNDERVSAGRASLHAAWA